MSSQVSDRREVELDAWISFLRAHAAVTRQFNSELQAAHGLTLNDFDVLAQLARVPDGTLKRVELSERFEKDELETLAELLARLPMRGDETACDPE